MYLGAMVRVNPTTPCFSRWGVWGKCRGAEPGREPVLTGVTGRRLTDPAGAHLTEHRPTKVAGCSVRPPLNALTGPGSHARLFRLAEHAA